LGLAPSSETGERGRAAVAHSLGSLSQKMCFLVLLFPNSLSSCNVKPWDACFSLHQTQIPACSTEVSCQPTAGDTSGQRHTGRIHTRGQQPWRIAVPLRAGVWSLCPDSPGWGSSGRRVSRDAQRGQCVGQDLTNPS